MRRVASGVMRPRGRGRLGLFMASSAMELGERWLDMLKMRRLVHTTRSADGVRERTETNEGDGLVVKRGPERAPHMAKRRVGMAKVGKSAAVKR